jgi:hypothetical protein
MGRLQERCIPIILQFAFYLELLQGCLTGELCPESYVLLQPGKGGLLQIVKRAAVPMLQSLLRPLRLELVRRAQYDPSTRREGMDWPAFRGELVDLLYMVRRF